MAYNVNVDWKFVLALGAGVTGAIFATKMDGQAAERVSTKVVDACKDCVIAVKGKH